MDITSNGRIQGSGIPDRYQVSSLEGRRNRATGSQGPREAQDKVDLSEHARLLKEMSDAVKEAPDVREEKVAKLREAIEQGKYQVSYEEIARAIIASRGR